MSRIAPAFAWMALIGLAACSTDEPGPKDASISDPDSGTPADMGVEETPCTLGAAAMLDVPVGTTQTATLTGEGWTEVTIASAPDGWRAQITGRTLEVRAPYVDGAASAALSLSASCGDRSATADVALSAEPLQWTEITPWISDDTGPQAREYFSMWIDPLDEDRLWVYGGFHYEPQQFTPGHDVWSRDIPAETWTRHADGPLTALPGATAAVDPAGFVLRYGGLNSGELMNPRDTPFMLQHIVTGTAGLDFDEITVEPAQLVGDYQPAFFFHPISGKFYAACGLNDGIGSHCNVHSYDPTTRAWTEEPIDGEMPPGRSGHFWAYDPETDRFVMFSGEGYPPSAGCDNCLHDTWALDLSATPLRWTRIAVDTPEIGRRNGAYALDPISHRLMVWGGTNDGATTHRGLWALDLTPGEETWYEVPTRGGAPVRTSGAAVFDAPRRRMLFGFGNGDLGVHADLWALGL